MGTMTSEALALSRPTSGVPDAAPRRPSPTDPSDRRAILTRAVQLQVIPQLLGRATRMDAASVGARVEQLARLSLRAEAHEVVDFVAGLLTGGFDADAVFLELLTPAAQLLGQYWVDDVCTFADVTVGVGHLQTAMHALRPSFFGAARLPAANAPRALLLPLPGEQHSFGASMLRAFFTRAGWDVWAAPAASEAELVRTVREDWIDLLGLSISSDMAAEMARRQVADLIATLRAASRNDRLAIMVGGLPFSHDPSLAEAVGADGTALDGAQAVEVAATLLPARSRSS